MPVYYPLCSWCGQPFAAARSDAKYCDATCRLKATRLFTPPSMRGKKRSPKQTGNSPPNSLLLTLLSGQAPPDPAPLAECKTCHCPLPPDSQFNYCSPTCRQIMLTYLKKLRPIKLLTRRRRRWNSKKRAIPNVKPYHQPPISEDRVNQLATQIAEEIARIYWEIGANQEPETAVPSAPRAPICLDEEPAT